MPLVFTHVVESLVFVPIMVGAKARELRYSLCAAVTHNNNITVTALQLGVLFFMFEFFGDQLLAFLTLIALWLCEVFSTIW